MHNNGSFTQQTYWKRKGTIPRFKDDLLDLFLFVSHSGMGKSSAIRALTGAGNIKQLSPPSNIRGVMLNVAYTTATHQTFVLPLALQEAKISSSQFYNEMVRINQGHAISALRYYDCQGLGTAQSYIDDLFRLSGRLWKINVITLGSAAMTISATSSTNILTTGPRTGVPTNRVAASARQNWGII